MSLGARATKGGAKAGKEGKHAQDKGKGTDKPQPKEKVKPQATTEQLRLANMIDRKSEDATDVRKMVLELMEMTCRTEEEVCSALHDSDNDMVAACNLLLEESQRIQGEWQTSEKKKKKPPAAGNGEVEPRARPPSTRPRRGEAAGGGRGRGGRGAAGRGGGRGGRRAPRGGRPPRAHAWPDTEHGGNMGDPFPTTEDWDNEEWSGSLSDTKVFTPSANAQNSSVEVEPAAVQNNTEDWDTPEANGPSENIPTYTYHNPHHHTITDAGGSRQSAAGSPADTHPALDHHPDLYHHQPMGMSGSLTAAQTQYLSQLTQQSQRHDNSVYSAGYGVYGADVTQRKPPRARVPPPSKIPSSAVEMPGGGEVFLDVQFGALETDTLQDTQSTSTVDSTSAAVSHDPAPEAVVSVYSGTMLSESVPVSSENVTSQLPSDPTPPTSAGVEPQLSSSLKQLSVSDPPPAAAPPPATAHHYHHRAKSTTSSVSSSTAAASAGSAGPAYVAHHPAPYGTSVYGPQANSTNASLTAASAMTGTAYPSSVTITQYQPIINSYQTSSSAAAPYGSALYTAAPYYHAQAQPHHHHHHTPPPKHKDHQYENSVASSNSLTSTSTTQTTTAKVTSTTNAHATQASSSAGTMATAGSTYTALYGGVGGVGGVGVGVGVGGVGGAGYAYDEAQLMGRTTTLPHHMGGYYEVGYGGREGTFGLGAGERFGRTDAASPQQVPAALPPGYAYFYQPPPTTYQYGVYPTYGGGSSVGGVGSGAGGKVPYTPQQPPYDGQDSYKQGGAAAYSGGGSKAASADLGSAIYKTHVALNKVNSYEKAGFHSGTPPPFTASHLYIPAPHHHQPQHHHHQMDARVSNSHSRRESGSGGGRGTAAKPPAASKTSYSQSYWTPN